MFSVITYVYKKNKRTYLKELFIATGKLKTKLAFYQVIHPLSVFQYSKKYVYIFLNLISTPTNAHI